MCNKVNRVQRVELRLVPTGIDPEILSLQIGFTMCFEEGERAKTYKCRHGLATLLLASQENVRCLMGYIVELHVILNEISKTSTNNVTGDEAVKVINNHVRSDRRSSIHQEIRSFVTEKFPKRYSDPTKDLFLEKIADLIRQYCVRE